MESRSLLFARYPILHKATVDDARMSVTAVLTFPITDLAGDWINPTGGIYKSYEKKPWCGLEHYRLKKGTRNEVVYPDDAAAGSPVVAGWLRESLSDPGASCSVRHKEFVVKGKKYALPVGTIYYDADSRFSSQVFAMVKADALPGVSLELAAPDGYEPVVLKARSPLEPHRPAWKFDKWEMCGVVNCAKPVNPGALVAKSVHDDALAIILDRRKVVTGNGTAEELHPLIVKAFADKAPGKSATVISGFRAEKAMPYDETSTMGDDEGAEPSVYDTAHDEGMGEEKGTPTAQAAYDAAQMCMDLCQQVEGGLEASEHKQGKKALLKLCEQLKGMAEKAIAIGDKVVSDVSGGAEMFDEEENPIDEEEELDEEDSEIADEEAEASDEEAETDEETDGEPEVEKDATEPDEKDKEKRLKAFRAPHRKVYMKSVRRFTAVEIERAPEIDIPTPVLAKSDPDEAKKLRLLKLQRRELRELLNS